jgi:hypothetical protein
MYNEKMMKYHLVNNRMVRKYKIKDIFKNHWHDFVKLMAAQNRPIRPVILKEVEKMIGCQEPENGYTLYLCDHCKTVKYVAFTCKSRFCNCCGAKYANDRALSIQRRLIDCQHRHVVFTIPKELRNYFAHDRKLLKLLFDAAAGTILYAFNKRNKSEDFTPGMACVLHTFGRDLKWNPHIHMILSEGGIGNITPWADFKHIPYNGLRCSWQYLLLKLLSERIQTPEFKKLVDELYRNNKNGFYVRALPNKMMNKGVADYVVRYIGRPAMAQSRITDYDGINVSFWYQPHGSEEIVHETVPVFEFIKKLIIHIPDRHFKMLRYYGLYCVRNKKYPLYLHLFKKMSVLQLESLRSVYKHWAKRIKHFFRREALKCACGHYFEFVDIYPRKKSNKWSPSTVIT